MKTSGKTVLDSGSARFSVKAPCTPSSTSAPTLTTTSAPTPSAITVGPQQCIHTSEGLPWWKDVYANLVNETASLIADQLKPTAKPSCIPSPPTWPSWVFQTAAWAAQASHTWWTSAGLVGARLLHRSKRIARFRGTLVRFLSIRSCLRAVTTIVSSCPSLAVPSLSLSR